MISNFSHFDRVVGICRLLKSSFAIKQENMTCVSVDVKRLFSPFFPGMSKNIPFGRGRAIKHPMSPVVTKLVVYSYSTSVNTILEGV